MDIIRNSMRAGLEEAWGQLAELDPGDVCRRTAALFDRERGLYRLKVFSGTMLIAPERKKISGETGVDALLLGRLYDYASLAIPGYLLHAQPLSPTGRFIKPSAMKGGQIYLAGSHMLPLPAIAARYGTTVDGFRERGSELGGEEIALADASVLLVPFALINMALLLWREDEEFPARADLLVDAACEFQLPPDIMWLTAMMTIAAML